jgi:hypothetical protein
MSKNAKVKLIKCNARNVNIDNYHYYLMARVRNLEVLRTGLGRREYLLFQVHHLILMRETQMLVLLVAIMLMLSSLSIPEWSVYLTLAV